MRKPTAFLDYGTRDYAGFKELMIEAVKKLMPEYTDFSDADMGMVFIEAVAYGLDIISLYAERSANESMFATARELANIVRFCKQYDYRIPSATPAKYKQVFIVTPGTQGVTIPAGLILKTKIENNEEVYYEVDSPLYLPAGKVGDEKDADGEYLYSTTITEGETVPLDILGTSSGKVDQVFRLSYVPVIHDSIHIFVDEGSGAEEWESVDDFINSDRLSKHYTISYGAGGVTEITFGNGRSGYIPRSVVNGVTAVYRVGGGKRGNVGKNTIVEFDNKPANIRATFNPDDAYVLGNDREDGDISKAKATRNLRTGGRAVTQWDFEDVVLNSPYSVLSAKSVILPTQILIYVFIKGQTPDSTNEETRKLLSDYLRDRKIIGIPFEIRFCFYYPFALDILVYVASGYNAPLIRKTAREMVEEMFTLGNYGISESLYISDIINRLMTIEGVVGVSSRPTEKEIDGIITPEFQYQMLLLESLNLNTIGGTQGA